MDAFFLSKKTPRPKTAGEQKAAEILVLLTTRNAAGCCNVFKLVRVTAGNSAAAFDLGIINCYVS